MADIRKKFINFGGADNYYFEDSEAVHSPDSAVIGQTIKVSAIDGDGKPTAWEAVDMPRPNSMTLIDSNGYFRDKTVEGALSEIGAELAGVNTLLGDGVIA